MEASAKSVRAHDEFRKAGAIVDTKRQADRASGEAEEEVHAIKWQAALKRANDTLDAMDPARVVERLKAQLARWQQATGCATPEEWEAKEQNDAWERADARERNDDE